MVGTEVKWYRGENGPYFTSTVKLLLTVITIKFSMKINVSTRYCFKRKRYLLMKNEILITGCVCLTKAELLNSSKFWSLIAKPVHLSDTLVRALTVLFISIYLLLQKAFRTSTILIKVFLWRSPRSFYSTQLFKLSLSLSFLFCVLFITSDEPGCA